MPWTLNEIASAIRNDVVSGMKGVTHTAFPIEQLEKEVVSERIVFFQKLSATNQLDIREFLQPINCVPIDSKALHKCCNICDKKDILHFEIPPLALDFDDKSIYYIGSSLRTSKSWKVYFNENYTTHKYLPGSGKKPYVWIDSTINQNGKWDGFIFNLSDTSKYFSITGLFSNPYAVQEYACCPPIEHFPAPDNVIEAIIEKLSKKYIFFYKNINNPNQPNSQTDKA